MWVNWAQSRVTTRNTTKSWNGATTLHRQLRKKPKTLRKWWRKPLNWLLWRELKFMQQSSSNPKRKAAEYNDNPRQDYGARRHSSLWFLWQDGGLLEINRLFFIYVIAKVYRPLHPLLPGVGRTDDPKLVQCTRERTWLYLRPRQAILLASSKIRSKKRAQGALVHDTGARAAQHVDLRLEIRIRQP